MLLLKEVTLLCIPYCCSFSHYLVEALQQSLACGHNLVCDYSSDDQCLSSNVEYFFMASYPFIFYIQISCALKISK